MVDSQCLKNIVQIQVIHLEAQFIVGVMRYRSVDMDELVVAAASKILHLNYTVFNADTTPLYFPDSIVKYQLRRVDVNIGLETAIGAAVEQSRQVEVAMEIMLEGHAPCQVSINGVVLATGIKVEVYHALLGRITRLQVHHDPVVDAIQLKQQARLLDDLVVALDNQRGIYHQVKCLVTLVEVTLDNGAVSQAERQVVHLMQRLVGIDDEIQAQVVGQAIVGIIGVVTKVLREGACQQVLDRGHNCLEVIFTRNEAIQVVALDADDFVIGTIVGIDLQMIEFQPLALVVNKSKIVDFEVARHIIGRVAPERGCGCRFQSVIGIFVGESQAGKIQPACFHINVIIGVLAIEHCFTVNLDAAIDIIHRQHTRKIVTLLVHIGGNVVVTCTLEVDKRDVSLQMPRHVFAGHQSVHLGIDGHLPQQVMLVQHASQIQALGLDMARKTVGASLLCQRAVQVGISQRGSHLAVKRCLARAVVQLTVDAHVTAARDDATGLWRKFGNEIGELRQFASRGVQVDAVQIQRAVSATGG